MVSEKRRGSEKTASTFEELVALIRKKHGLRPETPIVPETQFERDLGITGDDGDELLERVEKVYGIEFSRESFKLGPNEFLFHGESFDIFGVVWRTLRRKPEPEFRSFTVGELYEAIQKEIAAQTKPPRD